MPKQRVLLKVDPVDRNDATAVELLVHAVIQNRAQLSWQNIATRSLKSVFNPFDQGDLAVLVEDIEDAVRDGLLRRPAFKRLEVDNDVSKSKIKPGTLVQTLANKIVENVPVNP